MDTASRPPVSTPPPPKIPPSLSFPIHLCPLPSTPTSITQTVVIHKSSKQLRDLSLSLAHSFLSEHALVCLNHVNDVPVKCHAPDSLNVVKGVISQPERAYIDETAALDMFHPEDLVYYCKKQPDSATAVTGWRRRSTPPPTVTLGWHTVQVHPYIPRPTRCYNCQEYDGHVAAKCTGILTCPRCAESHKVEECPNT